MRWSSWNVMTLMVAVMVAVGANQRRTSSWRRYKLPPPFKYDKDNHRKWKGLSSGGEFNQKKQQKIKK